MPILQLLLWPLHMPRYFAGHVAGHAALLLEWLSWSLAGLAELLTGVGRYLCDLAPDEDLYDDFGDDDDDDFGSPLNAPVGAGAP